MSPPWNEITRAIESTIGVPVAGIRHHAVGGGSINSCYQLQCSAGDFFVKLNRPERLDMFAAEAEGLEAIAQTRTVRVPEPVCCGSGNGAAFLVMEYLPLDSGGRGAAEKLGEQLAAMHRMRQDRFGWHRDNTIGSTPQPNTPCGDWPEFLRECRIGFQISLAERNGYGRGLRRMSDRLLSDLGIFFTSYSPAPSLLHGDLWGGNHATIAKGEPVIFDPAVYCGDREADLAMTELFGGFGASFYAGYENAFPLDTGYPVRKDLYNLYHVLNHLNLFGAGYLSQAQHLMERLLSELG